MSMPADFLPGLTAAQRAWFDPIYDMYVEYGFHLNFIAASIALQYAVAKELHAQVAAGKLSAAEESTLPVFDTMPDPVKLKVFVGQGRGNVGDTKRDFPEDLKFPEDMPTSRLIYKLIDQFYEKNPEIVDEFGGKMPLIQKTLAAWRVFAQVSRAASDAADAPTPDAPNLPAPPSSPSEATSSGDAGAALVLAALGLLAVLAAAFS